jgi:hypothetical protein
LATTTYSQSAIGNLLQLFGVPIPLNRDLEGEAVDFTQIVGRMINLGCLDDFFQPGFTYGVVNDDSVLASIKLIARVSRKGIG